jgi:hypothetical protein
MNKSFSIFELILVLLILSIIVIQIKINTNLNKTNHLAQRIVFYLKYTRYQSLVNNQYNSSDNLWYMKRWSFKFLRCNNGEGLYFAIYSDKNKTGQISKDETLRDPLTNKYIYSSNTCTQNSTNSKYVLLTKVFDIYSVDLSCNSTSSLGQLSFGSNGKIYTKISKTQNTSEDYVLKEQCILSIKSNNEEEKIVIEPTGYIYLEE